MLFSTPTTHVSKNYGRTSINCQNCLQKFDISQKKRKESKKKNQSEPRKNTLEKVEKMGKAYSKTTLNCQWQSAGVGFGGGENEKKKRGQASLARAPYCFYWAPSHSCRASRLFVTAHRAKSPRFAPQTPRRAEKE